MLASTTQNIGMPIHHDTIGDGQKNLIFYSLSFRNLMLTFYPHTLRRDIEPQVVLILSSPNLALCICQNSLTKSKYAVINL